eukprot:16597-Heterococcus_DN1.PRE.1
MAVCTVTASALRRVLAGTAIGAPTTYRKTAAHGSQKFELPRIDEFERTDLFSLACSSHAALYCGVFLKLTIKF